SVLRESPLASQRSQCEYRGLLMKIPHITVRQVREIVSQFSCGRELCLWIKNGAINSSGRTKEWPEWVGKQLEALTAMYELQLMVLGLFVIRWATESGVWFFSGILEGRFGDRNTVSGTRPHRKSFVSRPSLRKNKKKKILETDGQVFVDRLENAGTSLDRETLDADLLPMPGTFPIFSAGDDRASVMDCDDGMRDAQLEKRELKGKEKPQKAGKRIQSRTVRSRHPNIEWKIKYRAMFLDQIMRGKGRGDARKQERCSDCKGLPLEDEDPDLERDRSARHRCHDCFLQDLVCAKCCVRRHWNTPFHRPETWIGDRFEKSSLGEMGLVVQLQHTSGFCTHPKSCYRHLLVLHTNGVHRINLQFCGCSKALPQHIQLLQRRLYPTNVRKGRISTVVTFQYLESLQIHTLTTKGSVYDFYRAIERLTDNRGLTVPKSRYRQLLRAIRQWRHLKLLMRAGKGQSDASKFDDEPESSLTLKCPSCPHPGINLPVGWQVQAAGSKSFLYWLCLCLDANFRLKEQFVSSHSRDPALCDGQGYFVGRKPYEDWVEENKSREDDKADEVSNCVPFAAMEKQGSKFSKGLRYTGVAGVVCGRSDMLVKVANLNKGERFSVIDYVLGMALQIWLLMLNLLLCYNIACQYFRNFDLRKARWPERISISNLLKIVVGIGKLHQPGHKSENHDQYSLNIIEGAAFTDGESCERFWSSHNALSNATKTMGPGGRQDLLESQFDWWNWEKVKAIGRSLLKRRRDALEAVQKQRDSHNGFTENIPDELVQQWEKDVTAWDNAPWPKEDHKQVVNPYKLREEFMGQAEAMKEMALEDEERLKRGGVQYHKMSAGMFVKASLNVRDRQDRLRADMAERKRDPTTRQTTKTIDERNAIRRHLKNLDEVRAIYMPGLIQHLRDMDEEEGVEEEEKAEDIPVWLPSSLPRADIDKVCAPGLADVEARLHKGRAHDALDGVRHTLRVKSRMVLFKNTNIRGNRDSGRGREAINTVESRAKNYAQKYRVARELYYSLLGEEGGDGEELPELKDSDVKSYKDPADVKIGPGRRGTDEWGEEARRGATREMPTYELGLDLIPADTRDYDYRTAFGTGETRRQLSWIWTYRGFKINVEDGADDSNDLLRAEWCRSRARVRRAQEEVELVKEEMRRTIEYMSWAARRWEELRENSERAEEKKERRERVEKGIVEGRAAYAREQADIQLALRTKFEGMWCTGGEAADDDDEGDGEGLSKVEDNESDDDALLDDDDGYE
ncbi:hypothetical protein V5O48_018447, partial [Marasmius crinis-equi]